MSNSDIPLAFTFDGLSQFVRTLGEEEARNREERDRLVAKVQELEVLLAQQVQGFRAATAEHRLQLDRVQDRVRVAESEKESTIAEIRKQEYAIKQALRAKLDRVKADREQVIQDVRNAEAQAEKWRRRYETSHQRGQRARQDAHHYKARAEAAEGILRVAEPIGELTEYPEVRISAAGGERAEPWIIRTVGEVPVAREDWRRPRVVPLDGGDAAGPQSPESPAAQTLGEPMSTQQIIAQAIATLKLIAWLTPLPFDDGIVRFLEANQSAGWLIALVEKILPATDPETLEAQSLVFEPEMVQALALFNKSEGRPALTGGGQWLTLILQLIALIKAGKAAIPAG